MTKDKIIYWVFTGLLCLLLFWSAFMYISSYDMFAGFYTALGYPTYLIYPLAGLKCLAAIAILSNLSSFLKHLAYAGLFFEFILAFCAHIMIGDGAWQTALIALVLLMGSYAYYKRLY